MPLPQLDSLVTAGSLIVEAPTQVEHDGLLRSGEARISDAENEGLSLESRFDLAYNAAHSFALAALRFHGYRPDKRYIVFQALAHSVGLPAEQWRVLDQAHRARNRAEYEGDSDPDAATVAAIIRIAREVQRRVIAFGAVPTTV